MTAAILIGPNITLGWYDLLQSGVRILDDAAMFRVMMICLQHYVL